jgi:hypothetical protein
VHSVSHITQIEIRTAELLVPYPNASKVEIAIAKFKRYKSPSSHQIPVKLNQAGNETILSEIHKLINFVWNKEELPDRWNESIMYQFTEKGNKADYS